MLGQFLEVALVCEDTGSAWQQLQTFGFAPAATGDIWAHAYGVVACAGVAIGLHAQGDEPLSVAFVRPEVAALHRELTARGIQIEAARLGSDVFNELTLREPGGLALRILEARSFSPPSLLPERTQAGQFVRLSLPCRNLQDARAFWQALGYSTSDVDTPWEGFAVDATPLACHPRRAMAEPSLVFRGGTLSADAFDAVGLPVRLQPEHD